MSYDINLHISESSDEGRAIASVAAERQVTPTEAVQLILKQAAKHQTKTIRKGKKPGELLIGLHADAPHLMDQIAREAELARVRESVKDYGV